MNLLFDVDDVEVEGNLCEGLADMHMGKVVDVTTCEINVTMARHPGNNAMIRRGRRSRSRRPYAAKMCEEMESELIEAHQRTTWYRQLAVCFGANKPEGCVELRSSN